MKKGHLTATAFWYQASTDRAHQSSRGDRDKDDVVVVVDNNSAADLDVEGVVEDEGDDDDDDDESDVVVDAECAGLGCRRML